MIHNISKNFMLCGSIGWCLECFWTGLDAILKKQDRSLTCKTSIWMFPIYGLAALILPISNTIKNHCALFRGGVYTFFIFFTEFVTGRLLQKYRACPWDYSKAKLNYKGVIRLDYIPVWFFVGLIYEKILKR
ncbi:putative ABC transporter permease [Anaeromicropila populeti]|uniref:putative ABC transporter permease n=1 Tax=Anaeromicropila populeti TaxID=37658 RepID=UPI000B86DE34